MTCDIHQFLSHIRASFPRFLAPVFPSPPGSVRRRKSTVRIHNEHIERVLVSPERKAWRMEEVVRKVLDGGGSPWRQVQMSEGKRVSMILVNLSRHDHRRHQTYFNCDICSVLQLIHEQYSLCGCPVRGGKAALNLTNTNTSPGRLSDASE